MAYALCDPHTRIAHATHALCVGHHIVVQDLDKGMTESEANKLFRYSDQAWLEHDRDPLLQVRAVFLCHCTMPCM